MPDPTPEAPPRRGTPYAVPPGGSLGLLAYGYRGLEAWRAARGTAWLEAFERPPASGEAVASGAEVVVVTGLPRAGTSLVMQMVEAAGVPPFTDGTREADPSNPRGYYEHERIKKLPRDTDWLPDADGHAVKVVAPLLPGLPSGPTYRVILVERDLDEVLRSQTAMLARSGRAPASAEDLRAVYARYVRAARAWAGTHAETLTLHHGDILREPLAAARALCAFLASGDGAAPEADPVTVAAVVDPSLHRQRA